MHTSFSLFLRRMNSCMFFFFFRLTFPNPLPDNFCNGSLSTLSDEEKCQGMQGQQFLNILDFNESNFKVINLARC